MKTLLRVTFFTILAVACAFGRGRASGYCQQGGQTIQVLGYVSSTATPVQASYTGSGCNVLVLYSNGTGTSPTGPSGTVSTNGTTVTWLSGNLFNANGQWAGLAITINSVAYAISSCASAVSCTLTSSAGTQTSVAYSMSAATPAAIFSDNAGTAKSNPFTVSSTGYWFYYADNGSYANQYSGTAIQTTYTNAALPLVDPASVLAVVDAEYPELSLQQLINITGSGKLYVTRTQMGPVAITANGFTLECYPGAVIQATSNTAVISISNATGVTIHGCAVNGEHSTGGYTGDCIAISGSSNVTISNSPGVTGCGQFGVHLNGDSSVNSHIKVLNSQFTFNQADAVFSEGALTDLEIAGNYADCSTGAQGTHVFAVHNGDGAGATHGPVQGVSIHDNVEWGPPAGNTNEVGAFVTGYALDTWPSDVHFSRNLRISAPSIAVMTSGDSFSFVNGFSVDGEIYDAQGNTFGQDPEIIASHGSVRGTVHNNCSDSQLIATSLNDASDVSLSDSTLCGQIYIGLTSASNIVDQALAGNLIHHNKINLGSGFVAAAMGVAIPAAIHVQLNDANASIVKLGIDHNVISGVSASDGTIAIAIENDACTKSAVIDQVTIDHNIFNLVQYGLANAGSCAYTNGILYTGNLVGSLASGGTVQTTSGGTAVVGTSTNFDNNLVGGLFTVNNPSGVASGRVLSVTDATHLALTAACSACQSASAQPYMVTTTQEFDPNPDTPNTFGSIIYSNPGWPSGSSGFSSPYCVPGPALGSGATCDVVNSISTDKIVLVNIATGSGATTGILFTLYLNPALGFSAPPGEFIGSPDVITGWGYEYAPSQTLFLAGTPGLVFQTNNAPANSTPYQVSVTIN